MDTPDDPPDTCHYRGWRIRILTPEPGWHQYHIAEPWGMQTVSDRCYTSRDAAVINAHEHIDRLCDNEAEYCWREINTFIEQDGGMFI